MFFSCAAASACAIGSNKLHRFERRQVGLLLEQVGKIFALEQLHRDEWIPEFGLAEVVDPHYRRCGRDEPPPWPRRAAAGSARASSSSPESSRLMSLMATLMSSTMS